MAKRPKHKMSTADRAKQFMPFSALKGLDEALKEKEKIIVPKIELSEDSIVELDRKMHLLKCGMIITVIYFFYDEYIKLTGIIAKIDINNQILQIVNTRIKFDDIYDILIQEPYIL
ncbi:MAG: YolD-like family protein [Eubacterium sp.]|nr:YolD-like family protein [Eubacterium sp.]